jgi:pentatricopeptide repeat protein
MSLFRTLDRTSAGSYTTNAGPFLTFLCPALQPKISKRSFSKSAVNSPPRLFPNGLHVGDIYIQALVTAASCREHAKQISTLREVIPHAPRHLSARQKSTLQKPSNQEAKAAAKLRRLGPLKSVKQFAKQELEALVDYYGIQLDTRPEEEVPDDGPLIWNVGDTHEPWPLRDPVDIKHIERLQKLLRDDETPQAEVFETYKKLPAPGVVYLSTLTIRAMLHHLAVNERPTPVVMQRFLSVLDDMKTAHIHIIRSEWTTAIYLAGRAMGPVSTDELQAALQLWRDMEQRAGVKGGFVTMNVLFDIAVKAEKYELAETFYKEMQARKISLHRHFRVSMLYYHGILRNGNAVRKTYQDLVNAGDIVDTVVLNSVIAALVRAGEPTAAEHVFERMKRLHATRTVSAPGHRFFNRKWRDRRSLGLYLTHDARQMQRNNEQDALKELQDYAPIAPDARTYGLLIRHHSASAGNIERVDELLQEMRYNSVPLEGTIFITIFQGFAKFGGVRYSSWTRDKLEKFWKQFLKMLQEGFERTWISVTAVISALKAFAKVTDADRTMRAWEEIRKMWEPSEAELENVMKVLRKLVPKEGEGFFNPHGPSP